MEGTATRSESLLRPREIQVRIRGGQSPETVAAAAQTTVERVMAYATPVLAERAFVAQQAAKASVRRRAGDGQVGLLGEAVVRRLETAGLDPDTADWDAWRREDGRWTVVAAYVEGGESRSAEFTYDAIGRYVLAEDDLARWLVGERRTPEPVHQPRPVADPVGGGGTQGESAALTTAGTTADPEAHQLALGDDALQLVTGRPLSAVPHPAAWAEPGDDGGPGEVPEGLQPAAPVDRVGGLARESSEPTEDLTETARAVRAAGAGPAAPPEGEALFEDSALRTPPETAAERRPPRAAGGSRNRRSMPSWDDIMLGSAPRGD